MLIVVVACIVPVTANATGKNNHQVTIIEAGSEQPVAANESDIGARIGMGDRIKVQQKSGQEIELVVIEVSTARASMEIDISGTYTSEVTGKTGRLDAKTENPIVRLNQVGNKVQGTFGKHGEIEGVIDGNRVAFDWYSSWTMGKGEWTVVEFDGGSKLTGSWESTHYPGRGDWNLNATSRKKTGSRSVPVAIIGTLGSSSARIEVKFADIEKIEILQPLASVESGSESLSATAADHACRISEAARTSIDRALQAAMQEDRIDPDALDLIDQAEAAAGPPECNNDKAIELAEEARRVADKDVTDQPVNGGDPTAEATGTPKPGKPVSRFDCDMNPGDIDFGSGDLGFLVSITMTTAYTSVLVSCLSSQASTDSTNRNKSEYSELQQRLFVRSVADRLAGDAARGGGEHLAAMAYLEGCPADTHARFARLAQQNFARLFPRPDADSEAILDNIENMIAADSLLASKCRPVS